MKPARLAVLGVAGLAAGAAALLMMRSPPPPEPVVVERPASVALNDVLVAAVDLPIGQTIKIGDARWQPWPNEYVPPGAMTRTDGTSGLGDYENAIVRSSFLAGEPIRREKLVRANSNAFMSAILPAGMRAVAISIDTRGSSSAGGFILPNDRVDVLRTYRDEEASKSGSADVQNSETILVNIRVLAIGQNIQEKNGEKVVTGETATLELSPSQAEMITLAQKTGQLALTLRSLADAGQTDVVRDEKNNGGVTVVRYGIARTTMHR